MLERNYDGIQAYCQSKLALVMMTFDPAEELEDSGITATCLHPATYMPTNMVRDAGLEPVTPLEDGVAATRRLVDSTKRSRGVNGHYFDDALTLRPRRSLAAGGGLPDPRPADARRLPRAVEVVAVHSLELGSR